MGRMTRLMGKCPTLQPTNRQAPICQLYMGIGTCLLQRQPCAEQDDRGHYGRHRYSNNALPMTHRSDRPMAAAAIQGCNMPAAAIGIASTL